MIRTASIGFLLSLLLCGHHARAQAPTSGGTLRFQHITAADGLTDNAVTCLFEDRAGYIWIGTEHGLNRYDGQRLLQFSGEGAPRGNRISSIAQDSSGTLWVSSSDGGLSRYDTARGAFRPFMPAGTSPAGLPTDRINHLLALNDSILVLATRDACLLWCNTASKTFFQRNYNIDPTVNRDSTGFWCHGTVRIDKDRIWLGLIPGGNSFILDAHNGKVLHDVRTMHADSLHSLSNAILTGGSILAGGWGPGITRIPVDHPRQQAYAPLNDEVTAIVPWGKDRFLAGTKINGLVLLDGKLKVLQRYRHHRNKPTSLLSNRVRCLLMDREGNLWAGTSEGLDVHAPAVWPMAVHELFPDEGGDRPDLTFHNLQQDPDGSIRIATSHGFFTLRNPQAPPRHIPLRHAGKNLEMTGLFRTGPHEYFAGTETGLFPYDPVHEKLKITKRHFKPSPYPGISMFQIRSVFADTLNGQHKIIVSAMGFGPNLLDPATLQYGPSEVLLHLPKFMAVTNCSAFNARSGRMWSGTSKGIYSWQVRHAAPVDTPQTYLDGDGTSSLPGGDVSAITLRGDTVWAAFRDGALATIVHGKVSGFKVPEGLPGDLRGLAFDARGRAWCPTGNGLVRFNPHTGSWLHVPVNNGLRFRQPGHCILKLRDGTMALCADNCLITFRPEAFDHLQALPAPKITELRNAWGGITAAEEGELKLSYRSSSFEADLSALQTTGPAPLEFLYRLEGLEKMPHRTTAARPLRYAGVPPGQHRLLVRVRDSYGREGPEAAVLSIAVAAPIWQRWWAYALLALLAGAAMYTWSRYRFRQRMKMQAVRDGIARDLHDDIGSTLGSISYYSEALKRKLDPEDGTARDVAEKIGANSREMIDRMSDIVWSVDPKNDDAGSLLERMKGYAADLFAASGTDLRFHTGAKLNERSLPTACRRALFLIFKEALHNTVKYAHCKVVDISLHTGDGRITMQVADDGQGFNPENTDSYNGNGLPGIRARAKSLGGSAEVVSSPGKGTCISVSLPLDERIPHSGD